jgi:hypothetical protein
MRRTARSRCGDLSDHDARDTQQEQGRDSVRPDEPTTDLLKEQSVTTCKTRAVSVDIVEELSKKLTALLNNL